MYGLHFRESLPESTAAEFDSLIARLKAFLLREHNEDGTHNFTLEGLSDTINNVMETAQAQGQWWRYGPWLLDRTDAPDVLKNSVGLRPPKTTTGTYHNWTPTGIDKAVLLEIEPDGGDVSLTGIYYAPRPETGEREKRFLFLRNRDSGNSLVLVHEDTGSIANFRFDLPEGEDVTLAPNQSVWLYYDVSRERWTCAITGTASGGLITQTIINNISQYVGGLNAVQSITSGTAQTYTVPANVSKIRVRVQGGGGGGGGADGAAGAAGASQGGYSGSYAEKFYSVTPGDQFQYTVGGAGTGGTAGNNSGTAGGTTTWDIAAAHGTSVVAAGGAGGGTMASGSTFSPSGVGTTPALGDATGGDINVSTVASERAVRYSASTGFCTNGASSRFGSGGIAVYNSTGNNGVGYGSGGSGTFSNTATDRAGGDGKGGIIIVEEYL